MEVEYRLFNHGKHKFAFKSADFDRELDILRNLPTITKPESYYFRNIPTLSGNYAYWLQLQPFPMNNCTVQYDRQKLDNDGVLDLSITGKWIDAVLWPTPLLSLISEMHYRASGEVFDAIVQNRNLQMGDKVLQKNRFMELGTHCRFSSEAQALALQKCKFHRKFQGTSNVYLALQTKTQMVCPMPHEWFLAHLANSGIEYANFNGWVRWIDGKNEFISLTPVPLDTFSSDFFFRSVPERQIVDVIRHFRQSFGDPEEFMNRIIAYFSERDALEKLKTKSIMFTDGLTFQAAERIMDTVKKKKLFTHYLGLDSCLTNNVGVAEPLQISIVPVAFDGISVAYLGDRPLGEDASRTAKVAMTQVQNFVRSREEINKLAFIPRKPLKKPTNHSDLKANLTQE
jgi:nicotinic acid phosphoribosyltransferase